VLATTFLVLLGACNNAQEHARNLRLPGLLELVCKGVPYDSSSQACGPRSLWKEADWGTKAYITVYGVESPQEADQIAQFVLERRRQNKQEHIRINLRVYSTPRAAGREPAHAKIFEKEF
jgi:hypothetical protein